MREGYFDATLFHQVIDSFMIQNGGITADFTEKDGEGTAAHAPIRNEAENGLRTPPPHSASSQFFINVSDNAFLDYRGPGRLGLLRLRPCDRRHERGERHQGRQTGSRHGHQDVPVQDVVIEKAEIVAS